MLIIYLAVNRKYLYCHRISLDEPILDNKVHVRNEFHFSDVCRSINYIGCKGKEPEGVHVNFDDDPV